MARMEIKDRSYRIVGYIDTDRDGKQTALDASYRHVGYYDPRTNQTKDASYRIIGTGNQLSSLIHR